MKRGASCIPPADYSGGRKVTPPTPFFCGLFLCNNPHHTQLRLTGPSQARRFEIVSDFLMGPLAVNDLISIVLGYAGMQVCLQPVIATGNFLLRHAITAVAALPAGHFVSGSLTGLVKFWEPDGTLLCDAVAHRNSVPAFAVTASGLVVSISADMSANVLTLTGELKHTFIQHRACVVGVAALHDGHDDIVATASADGRFYVWCAKSARVLKTFTGHHATNCLALLPGRMLAVGAADSKVRFLNLERDGRNPVEGHGHSDQVTVVVPLPNSFMASGSLDGNIIVWNPQGAPFQKLRCFDRVCALAVMPDGTLASASGNDGDVRVWDWMEGDWLLQLTGPTTAVHGLAVLDDGTLVAADMGGNFNRWRWA
jgi:WD40 repeat protein